MQLRPWLLMVAVTLAAAAISRLSADDPAASEPTTAAFVATGDAGFDHYLDTERLQQALETLDGAALTDIALQLAEGERVLLRKHAGGVTPQALLDVALKLAAAAQDAETLSRIGQAAGHLKLADLQSRAAALVDVANATRSTQTVPALAADGPTAAQAVFNHLQQQLQLATALGDRAAVEQIRDGVSAYTDLTKDLQTALAKQAAAALAEMPAAAPAQSGDATDLLRQLAADSRAVAIKPSTALSKFNYQIHNYTTQTIRFRLKDAFSTGSMVSVKPNSASSTRTYSQNDDLPWPTLEVFYPSGKGKGITMNFGAHPWKTNPIKVWRVDPNPKEPDRPLVAPPAR